LTIDFPRLELQKQATALWLWRSNESLHLEFAVQDDFILATQTQRDGPLWEEEVVEVFLDPVGDLQAYFEIEINPLGTVTDLLLRKVISGWRKEFRWDCEGLETQVQNTEEGWKCELTIPFTAVCNEAPHAGTIWRANFLRVDRPAHGPRELSAWSPTLSNTFHVAQRFGFLEFAGI
jgi:hypothetical protein